MKSFYALISFLSVPFITLVSPHWLKIQGVGPCWSVLWLLPFSLRFGSWLGFVAGLSLGLILDALTLGGASYIPSLAFLGVFWGYLGGRSKQVNSPINLGLHSLFGAGIVGSSLWAQKLFYYGSFLALTWFNAWSLHTLMAELIITGLMAPTQGQVEVLETCITELPPFQKDQFRASHFGIIFQLFNLIPYLSVIENITLPCLFSSYRKARALQSSRSLAEEAKRLCSELDIQDTLLNKPTHRLSLGQQQRVAIARALIGQPEIIIADEPTSALDHERKERFLIL